VCKDLLADLHQNAKASTPFPAAAQAAAGADQVEVASSLSTLQRRRTSTVGRTRGEVVSGQGLEPSHHRLNEAALAVARLHAPLGAPEALFRFAIVPRRQRPM